MRSRGTVQVRNTRPTIKRILHFIKHYRLGVICSLVLAFVTVALTLYIPILTGQAVDKITAQGDVDFAALRQIILVILISAGITSVAQWVMSHINNAVTYRIVRDVRTRVFDRLMRLPLSYLDTHPAGDTISRIITDVDQFSEGLLMGFTQLFTGVLTILGTLIFMLIINPLITLGVVVLTPISLLVANFVAKRTYAMFSAQSRVRGELTGFTEEMLGGIKVVKTFGYENETHKKFDEINERLKKNSFQATFFSSLTNPSARFVNSLVYVFVVLTGSHAAISGLMTVGKLTTFLSYANQYTKPFNEISGVVTELENAVASAERVFELLDEQTETPDAENAEILHDVKGEVALDKISFSYTDSKQLIKEISLSVLPGKRVAIVGPTGCGKTTLINLLMRFYDVNGGAILVEGKDIRGVTRHSLRENYGMVLQDTWLRSGTIRDNIAYGKPSATDAEVEEAARQASAHGFISRMPHGYNTVISEDGENLSQGQKQLLCIARVMLSLPPMLILDEATSSIDTRTELRIQKNLAKMMQGRTSFIVAHRLSTIREADIILVMRDGNIIEQGSHDQLIEQGGFYVELYNSQFAKV